MADRRRLGTLGEALRAVLARQQLEGKAREHAAMGRWAEVVGADSARHSRPERVSNGVMSVAADSPVWAQTLQMMKPQILARLAELVGPGVVRDLRFGAVTRRRAQPPAPEPAATPLQAPSRAQLGAIPLSPEQQERKEAWRQRGEPELGKLLARGYVSLCRMRRFREKQGWESCPRCGRPKWGPGRWCVLCTTAPRARR